MNISDFLFPETLEIKSRKSLKKAKGLRNKHSCLRTFGYSHNELKDKRVGDFGISKSSYYYPAWRSRGSPGYDTYVPKNTYQKLHIIQEKPAMETIKPSWYKTEIGRNSDLKPHPPSKPKDAMTSRRGRKVKWKPLDEDGAREAEDGGVHIQHSKETSNLSNTGKDMDTAKQGKNIGAKSVRRRIGKKKGKDNDPDKLFLTEISQIPAEKLQKEPLIDQKRFEELPPIVIPPQGITRLVSETSKTLPNDAEGKAKESKQLKMWELVNVCLNQPGHDKTIVFSSCKTGSKCVSEGGKSTESTNKVPHPPAQPLPTIKPDNVKNTSNRAGNKEKQSKVNDKAEKGGVEVQRKKKNNYGKRQRDRIKRRKLAETRGSGQGKVQTAVETNPFLITKIKTESTQSSKLHKKYGACFKESSTSKPAKFWIDVTDKVLGVEEQGTGSSAKKVIAVLVFENVTSACKPNTQNGQQDNFTTYRYSIN